MIDHMLVTLSRDPITIWERVHESVLDRFSFVTVIENAITLNGRVPTAVRLEEPKGFGYGSEDQHGSASPEVDDCDEGTGSLLGINGKSNEMKKNSLFHN